MISKEQVLALSEGMKLLEDAKKAGMKFAARMRSKPITEKEQRSELVNAFREFKQGKKDSKYFSEKLAVQYFLNGYQEAYED